ncbi:MAG: LamG domain-containing protein [Chitinophagaceae bacterium]|nr:MAG: LamG domain-containing protein [Chitinophagaceae bacterium]
MRTFRAVLKSAVNLGLLLTTLQSQSQTNNAIVLNGSNGSVAVGPVISPNASYTKEAWVYLTTATGARNILSSQDNPFWVDNGVLKAGNNAVYNNVTDPAPFPLNQWVHAAVTYDYSTGVMTLYRNGVQVSQTTIANRTVPSNNSFIGSHSGTSSYFVGRIDEVRVWTTVRTAAEINATMYRNPALNTPGLRAYYNMNETSGNALNSASSGGYPGTASNITRLASPVTEGRNGLQFDGVDDFVDIGNNTNLKRTGAITVELWARRANWAANNQQLVSCHENGGYALTITGDSVAFRLRPATGASYVGPGYALSNLSNNQWYHIAGTFDGQNIRIYVDGVLRGTHVLSAPSTIYYDQPNNIFIGADPTATNTFQSWPLNGAVDEVRIWNTARNATQISSGMSGEMDPATTGLQAYYTFNQGTGGGDNTGIVTIQDKLGRYPGTVNGFAMTGTASNFTDQPMQLIALPVVWKHFEAQKHDQVVQLSWSTSQEQLTKDFTVAHSLNGSVWKSVGSVHAAGQSTSVSHYSYVHSTPAQGVNYYRIEQRDLDGKTTYSVVRTVQFGTSDALISLSSSVISGGVLNINLGNAELVRVVSSDGRIVWKGKLSGGNHQIRIANLRPGIYTVAAGTETMRFLEL